MLTEIEEIKSAMNGDIEKMPLSLIKLKAPEIEICKLGIALLAIPLEKYSFILGCMY